jgi:hypothetical protein
MKVTFIHRPNHLMKISTKSTKNEELIFFQQCPWMAIWVLDALTEVRKDFQLIPPWICKAFLVFLACLSCFWVSRSLTASQHDGLHANKKNKNWAKFVNAYLNNDNKVLKFTLVNNDVGDTKKQQWWRMVLFCKSSSILHGDGVIGGVFQKLDYLYRGINILLGMALWNMIYSKLNKNTFKWNGPDFMNILPRVTFIESTY